MPDLDIKIGSREIEIRKRYEFASIVNDVLIALWFVAGSVLFFFESTTLAATWCFLLGSIEFLVRPVIRMVRHVHVTRMSAGPSESAMDF